MCFFVHLYLTAHRLDKNKVFCYPVDAKLVPDYYEIVKNPMDFFRVGEKINNYDYESLDAFGADVELIVTNALLYNKIDTSYAKLALKIRDVCRQLLANASITLRDLEDRSTGSIPALLFGYVLDDDHDDSGEASAKKVSDNSETPVATTRKKQPFDGSNSRKKVSKILEKRDSKYWQFIEVDSSEDEMESASPIVGDSDERTLRRRSFNINQDTTGKYYQVGFKLMFLLFIRTSKETSHR
jgi:hypothetical protein